MKKALQIWALVAMLFVPWATQAQNELTVADGTATNNYVPIYGTYVDDYVRCQIIYPATDLEEMVGGTISGLSYYLSSPASASWGSASFDVLIMEVDATTLSAYMDISDAMTVYSGSLDGTQSTMTIELSTPYTYQGGNLLVEIHSTADGTYKAASFYGISASGASWQGYNSSSWSNASGSARNFIPKTTFTYTPGGGGPICYKPGAITVENITDASASISWTTGGDETSWNVYLDGEMLEANVTNLNYTYTGLNPNTAYTFGVTAICGDEESALRTAQVRTACAGMSLPYTCGFEADELQGTSNSEALPWCAYRYASGTGSYTYYPYSYNSTSYAYNGSRSLYYYGSTYSSYPDTMVFILPAVDVNTYPMNGNRLSFWAKMSSASYSKMAYIGTMSDPEDINTFTLADTILVSGTTHTKYIANLPNANPADAHVAIMVLKGSGTMYVDDVTLEVMPSCVEISNLTASNITSNSVTLTWDDEFNVGAGYTIWDHNGLEPVTFGTTEPGVKTATLTNLPPNTWYTFAVAANCSADDNSGEVGISSLRTLNNACEITGVIITGDAYRGEAVIDSVEQSVTVPVRYIADLTTLSGNINSTGYQILIYDTQRGWRQYYGMQTIGQYITYNEPLTVRVMAEDTNVYKDWTITLVPEACSTPNSLTLTAERASATAKWTVADPAAKNFQLVITEDTLDINELDRYEAVEVSDTTTYTFTGLNRETTYYVYLRTTCGEDGNSEWVMASITTKSLNFCEDVVIAEGTTTNQYLPIYGNWGDAAQRNQMLYPASMLSELQNKALTAMTFFPSSPIGNWKNNTITIKIANVTGASLESAFVETEMETVYSGNSLTGDATGMTITFPSNFTYTGGDLLIELNNEAGSYSSTNFYGVSYTNGGRYSYSSTNSLQSFLPKVAFTYCEQSDPCPAVAEVEVSDITETGATISWTASTGDYVGSYEVLVSEDTAISYNEVLVGDSVVYEVSGDVITVENGTTYTLGDLNAYTEYYVFVRAICNAEGHNEGSSTWQRATFRTLSACGAVSNMTAEITGKNAATVSWEKTKPNQASNFTYILSTSANLTDEELNGMTPTGTGLDSQSVVLTGLENSTTYYIYVQNVCGSDDFSPWVSTIFNTYDAMPTVAYIFVADITHSAISVEWERNMELFANETAWQVACVPDSTEVTDWTVVTTPSHTFIGLNANTPYTIHVRPYNTETSVYGPDATLEVITNDMPAACEIVADGTTTHSNVPLDFYNTDGSSEMHAQMLYPSNLLTRLVGSPIESITFYHQSNVTKALSFSQWTIKMGVTTATDLSNGFDETTLTTVYTGNLEVTGGEFSFVFEDPFEYSGGNLIIDISLPSGSKSGNWFGSSNQGCYGVDGIGSTYSSMSSPNYTSFLPKVQICYERNNDACIDLANVVVSDVTANSAHVSWIPGNVETEWQYALVSAETSLQDIVENPEILTTVSNQTSIDLTNLNADFDYYLYIRPVCGDSNYGNFTERKFQTLPTCGIPTVLPATNIGTTYATLHVMADTTVGTPMNYTFRIWPEGEEDQPIMVTSTTDSVVVGDLKPNTDYYYEAQTTCTDNNGSSRWSSTPMSFQTGIACFPVDNLQVVEATANSVTLAWDGAEGISTYGLLLDSVYLGDYSDTTYTFFDLEPNTQHTFGVYAYCGNYNSEVAYASARTACAPMPYPWQESFEASINNDPCWNGNTTMAAADVFNGDTLQLNAANAWQFTNTESNGIEADHYKVNIYGTSCKKWLITPEIDLSGEEVNSAMLYFDVAFTTYSGSNPATNFDTNSTQAFMVLVSTDGGYTWPEAYATKWQNEGGQHTLDEIASSEFIQQTVDLNQFVGNTIRIAFYAQSFTSGGDNNLHLDNITVTEAPAVFPVSNLTVDSVTANSVTLSWTDENNNPDSTVYLVSYDIDYMQVNETTATITGLNSNTTYTFYVMAQNPAGEISIDKSIEVTTEATCFPVSNLYFEEVTTESVTLSWLDTINNGATYTVDISMLINDSLETVATYNSQLTTITINGLTPWTAYYFNVYANCTASDQSDAVQAAITTPCEAFVLPYAEEFDANGGRDCWNLVASASSNVGGNNGMGFVDVNNRTTLRFSSYSNATDYNQYAFSPILTVPADAANLSVNITYATKGNSDQLQFGYLVGNDTVWDTEMHTTSGNTDWQTYTVVIPATATQIAIHYYGNYSYWAWVDQVKVKDTTICPPVENLTVTEVTPTSVTVTWSDNNSSGYSAFNVLDLSLHYEWNVNDDLITDTTYTFTGLIPHVQYTLGIDAWCSGIGSSEIHTVDVRTACAACDTVNLPYVEDFENYNSTTNVNEGTTVPNCWDFISSGKRNPHIYSTGDNNVLSITAGHSFCLPDNYAILPSFNLGLSQLKISFSSKMEYLSSNWLTLGYITNIDDTTSFVGLFNVPATDSFSTYEYSFAGQNIPSNARIAFRWYRANSFYYVNIDNVTVTEATIDTVTGCPAVASLGVYITDENYISFSWPENGGQAYQVAYGTVGFDPSNEEESTYIAYAGGYGGGIITTPIPTGTYDAYVRTSCFNNDSLSYSVWTGPTTFSYGTTDTTGTDTIVEPVCNAVALPYAEEFENGIDCWRVYGNTTGGSHEYDGTGISNQEPFQGNFCFKFLWSIEPPQYLISPELTGTNNGVTVNFMYRASNENYPESFVLGYSTTTNDTNAFIWGTEQENIVNTTYEAYTEVLPAGTKYVAVKYTAYDKMSLKIDNFSLTDPTSTDTTGTDTTIVISCDPIALPYRADFSQCWTLEGGAEVTTDGRIGLSAPGQKAFSPWMDALDGDANIYFAIGIERNEPGTPQGDYVPVANVNYTRKIELSNGDILYEGPSYSSNSFDYYTDGTLDTSLNGNRFRVIFEYTETENIEPIYLARFDVYQYLIQANITGPDTVFVGDSVTYTASCTTSDGEDENVSMRWWGSASGNYTNNITLAWNEPGSYSLGLTVTKDNVFYDCSARASIGRNIIVIDYDTMSVIACDSYLLNDSVINESGIYSYQDSPFHTTFVDLTIIPSTSSEFEVTAEDVYVWDSVEYRLSGDYTNAYTAANGCDSTVTMHLTVNYTTITYDTVVACDSYTLYDSVYTESGTYTIGGLVLELTINYSTTNVLRMTAEESYTWDSIVYTESGSYTHVYTAANGCDSTVTLNLTIVPTAATVPYYTGFEAGEDISWLYANNENGWVIGTATNNGGSQALYISNDDGVSNAYTVGSATSCSYAYKTFGFENAQYSFSFDWRGNGESNLDYLRVFAVPASVDLIAGNNSGIGTTGAPEGWIALDGGNKLNLDSNWHSVTNTFTLEEAGNYNIVFYWRNDGNAGSNPPAAIDNVSISAPITCPDIALESLTFESTATSFTAHWQPAGNETAWKIWLDNGDPDMDNWFTTIVTDTFYTFDSLTPNTGYWMLLSAYCSEDDISSYIGKWAYTLPTCMPVSNLEVAEVTTNSIYFSWSDSLNSDAQYSIYLLDNGTSEYRTSLTDFAYYIATDLTPNTSYTFSVEAVCGDDVATSVTLDVHTACGIMELPYVEDFENGVSCWNLVSNNTTNVGGNNGMGFASINDRSTLRFSSYNNADDYNQYAFSPILNVSADSSMLGVSITYATNGSSDILQFGYIAGNDTVWDATEYTTSGNIDWQTYTTTIPTTATQIAIHYFGNYAYYAWVDEISVNYNPCVKQLPYTANFTDCWTVEGGATIIDNAHVSFTSQGQRVISPWFEGVEGDYTFAFNFIRDENDHNAVFTMTVEAEDTSSYSLTDGYTAYAAQGGFGTGLFIPVERFRIVFEYTDTLPVEMLQLTKVDIYSYNMSVTLEGPSSVFVGDTVTIHATITPSDSLVGYHQWSVNGNGIVFDTTNNDDYFTFVFDVPGNYMVYAYVTKYNVYNGSSATGSNYLNITVEAPLDIACENGDPVTVSNAETSIGTINEVPGYSLYNYSYSEVIIPAEQLEGIGTVKALQFKPSTTNGGDMFTNCEVYLTNTTLDDLSTDFIQDADAFQLVWSGDINYTSTGWQSIVFDQPFEWDGQSNIVVAVLRNTGSYADGSQFESYDADAVLARFAYRDDEAYTLGSITSGTGSYNVPLYHLVGCAGEIDTTETPAVDTVTSVINWACDSYTNDLNGETYTESGTYIYEDTTNNIYNIIELNLKHSTTEDITVEAEGEFVWNDQIYTESGIYTDTLTNAEGCDSIVNLYLTITNDTVVPAYDTTYMDAVACDSYEWDGETYYQSGVYSFADDNTMTVTILNLTVNYSSVDSMDVVACDSYDWMGLTYNYSDVLYFDSIDANGCTHATVLTLTINYSSSSIEDASACNTYVWHGVEYTASTDSATYTTTDVNGCDSTITLYLTIDQCSTTEITVCNSYTWHDNVYTESGMYVDGTDTLMLTVNHSTYSVFDTTVCDSYVWNDSLYTEGGEYSFVTTNALGCDSTAYLYLSMNYNSNSSETFTVCDSLVWYDEVYTATGTYFREYEAGNGCPSVDTLYLTVNYNAVDTFYETACDSYLWPLDSNTYSYSDVYYYSNNTDEGCLYTAVLNLTINNSTSSSFDTTACDSYVWNDSLYTEGGVYTFVTTNALGCDSTAYLYLSMNYNSNSSETFTVCDSLVWYDEVYTATGTYFREYEAGNGCPSVDTLYLTVNYNAVDTFYETACDSYLWPLDSNTYSYSDVYYYSNSTAEGCLYTAVLNLTINNSTSSSFDTTACDSYVWNDSLYTEGGVYTFVTTNALGCDSTAYLYLSMNYNSNSSETFTVCDSLVWYDEVYTATGTYFREYEAGNGCPSVDTLYLTVNYNAVDTFYETACDSYLWPLDSNTYSYSDVYYYSNSTAEGCLYTAVLNLTINYSTATEEDAYGICDTFVWNNTVYTQAGDYSEVFQALNGCDSTATLHLFLNYSSAFDTAITACDELFWNDQFYYESGTYTFYTTNLAGCDSTVTLYLTVNHNSSSSETLTVCDSTVWHGETYTYSDDFFFEYEDGNGCASLDTLHLTVNYSTATEEDAYNVCDTFVWNNTVYTQAGDYSEVFQALNGCDSTATLHLFLNYSSAFDTAITACDELFWNDQFYYESGTYTFYTTNLAGCDSTVTLYLTVNHNSSSSETLTVCDSTVWHGETYTYSDDFFFEYEDGNGCASLDTLHLTVNYSTATEEDAYNVCDTFVWNNTVYTQAGDYSEVFQALNGCDSTATLHLFLNYSSAFDTAITACDEFFWNDQFYYESGTYTFNTTNLAGCDSIVTLYLTVNHNSSSSETLTVCDSTTWHGETYTYSDDFFFEYEDGNGCASLDTLHLTVNYSTATEEDAYGVCDTYSWNGSVYTQAGDYSEVFQTLNGCDSTATLHLFLNYSSAFDTAITACDEFFWNDQFYYESGTYTFNTTNLAGCDSTVTLYLTVNHNSSSSETLTVCDSTTWHGETYTYSDDFFFEYEDGNGCASLDTLHLTVNYSTATEEDAYGVCDTYSWNGSVYTQAGDYSEVFQALNGCDSTATLHLFLNYSSAFDTAITACDELFWIDQFYYESGTYTFNTTNLAGCDSTVTLYLTIGNAVTSSMDVSVCDSYTWNGTTYTTSGVYTYTTEGSNGCDSIAELNLTVGESATTILNVTSCDSYVWNGQIFTTSASNVTWQTTNGNGCDSIVILNLTINYRTVSTEDITACNSYEWHGETYTASNNSATYLTTNANGCDSTVTLNLTINYSTVDTMYVTACDSYEWWGGQTFSTSGQYSYDTTNVNSCESTTILDLTINQSTSNVETITACNSYTWHGATYTTSTDNATYTTSNAVGCDSTVTLNLTVNRSSSSTIVQTVCDSYEWDDTVLTNSGMYNFISTNAVGCDSSIILNLTVNRRSASSETDTACDSYTWNGETYTVSGQYSYTTTNAAGCDSTVTLNLTIGNSTNNTETVVACNAYKWNNILYNESGVYSFSTVNETGCESISTLYLTINHSSASTETVTACDSYEWNGEVYTTSGDHTFTSTNAAGCDSTVTLNLTINNSSVSTETETACDSYTWHGTTYTSTTSTPTYTTTNAVGCDSTVTLNLTLNHSTTGIETVTACDSYTWHGSTYTSSTSTPTYTIFNAAGCDSTVTLNLTVNHSTTGTETITACNSYVWHGVEYFASTDNATFTTANAAGCDSTITLHLTINQCSSTQIIACDSYTWHGNTYTASGMYVIDGDTLLLTINRSSSFAEIASACDSYAWNDSVYTNSGRYNYRTTNAIGCDSTVTLNLTIRYSTVSTEVITACDRYNWHGINIPTSISGLTYTTTNAAGCDSTVTLNLTINRSSTGIETVTACDNYTWYGQTYTASNGNATHTLVGSNIYGCDSTVTLHLTVNYSSQGDTSATACSNFTWYGNTYTSSTSTPTYTTTNAVGCDSTVTLHLTINNCSTTIATACGAYYWNGNTYTSSGIYNVGYDTLILTVFRNSFADTFAVACGSFDWYEYTDLTGSQSISRTLIAANGCDSTVTLHLTVNQCSTTEVTACGSYNWRGINFVSSGTYIIGTDTLILTINRNTTGDTIARVCGGLDWYEYENLTTSQNVSHTFLGGNANGCDSTVTLHLTVKQCSVSTVVACDSYEWHGYTLTSSGTYTENNDTLILTINRSTSGDTLALSYGNFDWYEHTNLNSTQSVTHTFANANVVGCDSTVTLHLLVASLAFKTSGIDTVVACDSYVWHGFTLTSSGMYPLGTDTLLLTIRRSNTGDTLASACGSFDWYEHTDLSVTQNIAHTFTGANVNGCDSTVTLHLTINQCSVSNVTACDSYTWHGLTFTSSGSYHDGLDTLNLTINHSTTGDTTATACSSFDWYEYTDMNTSQNVDRTFFAGSANGCDSTVTLHLTINHCSTTVVNACDSYDWHGFTITSSGTYHDGFDTLLLTVNHSSTEDTAATACGSFTWYEHSDLTASQDVAHTFVAGNAYGCDKTVTLHLTINNCSTTRVAACGSYTWLGNTYASSGVYNVGHDTLILTINRNTTADTIATACDSFDWYEHTNLTSSQNVIHTFVGGNANGCDSTVTLHLTVNHCSNAAIEVCDSYTWHGNVYYNSGLYIDGTDTLQLVVNHSTASIESALACDSYTWHGVTYTSTTSIPTYTTTNAVGCDSTVTLNLTVNYSTETTVTETATGSYTWNGNTYSESGTYYWYSTTVDGCDSTVTLILTVTTGIDDVNSEITLNVYPNPTTSWITIDADDILKVEVYDLYGRKLATHQNTDRINLQGLASGTYTLRVQTLHGTAIQRVLLK